LPADLRSSLTLPAFAAPMFLVGGVELAVACCEAGIVGSLTRNHCRDLAELEEQLMAVREALKRFADSHPGRTIGPLCVNISPTFGQDEFREDLAVCATYGVRTQALAHEQNTYQGYAADHADRVAAFSRK
jgi:nitronate monooxygenase